MGYEKDIPEALAALALLAFTLVSAPPASAYPHTVASSGQVFAKGQDHAPFVNGVSCGGDPAAYGLETAHHGPDAGTPAMRTASIRPPLVPHQPGRPQPGDPVTVLGSVELPSPPSGESRQFSRCGETVRVPIVASEARTKRWRTS